MLKLVLASQSPRRRELLQQAGYEFQISLVKVSEIFDESLNPPQVASHLATVKARACLDQHKHLNSPGYLILGADTIVCTADQILGKPQDTREATDFLRRLSGKTHNVITGIALLKSGSTEAWSGAVTTAVSFRDLSSAEIAAYVASGEPMDKAGGYGIQGGARAFVSKIEGSWSNVVGLPLERLEEALLENGWDVGRRPPQRS